MAARPWAGIPIPDYPAFEKLNQVHDPIAVADTFLGIPYRNDGALDESGRFCLFEHPEKNFSSPGLNCSGLVVGMSRFLLNRNFTIAAANRDRQNNSGSEAPAGRQWDFGFDLVFNLAEGFDPVIITPDGPVLPREGEEGDTLIGFDLQSESAWAAVLPRIKPGRLYLASFSKQNPIRTLHYHVGVILADPGGAVWLYHTTTGHGRSYKIDLNSKNGLARFRKSFPHTGAGVKHLLILEVKIAGIMTGD